MPAAKPLSSQVPIVQPNGTPTAQFQRDWQGLSTVTGQIQPDTYVRKGQLTGWASPTGTTSKATFATYAAPAISNPPTQAEVQALANAVQVVSQHLAGLINDLKTLQVLSP